MRGKDRELKEIPWDKLGGISQRNFLIKISEEWVKPHFGKGYYGEIAGQKAKSIIENGENAIFSDGGFQEEFDTIANHVGSENIVLIRLHREGCTFEGDSRGYVGHPLFYMQSDLHNNDSIDSAVVQVMQRAVTKQEAGQK